jgi:hypothetical protein
MGEIRHRKKHTIAELFELCDSEVDSLHFQNAFGLLKVHEQGESSPGPLTTFQVV